MKYVKRLAAIIVVIVMMTTNPITSNAEELPSVGIADIIYSEEYEIPVYNEEELRLMASIIWCEAGNQCEAGKQAVGIVVINRVENEDHFGSTIKEVIYAPGQFRPKNDGRLNQAFNIYDTQSPDYEWERMLLCIEAAKYAMDGNKVIIYEGQEIDMSPYYYFATHWDQAKITVQDHDFR